MQFATDVVMVGRTGEAGHSMNGERQEQNQARSMSGRPRLVRDGWSILCLISLDRSCVHTTRTCTHILANRTTTANTDRTYVMWD